MGHDGLSTRAGPLGDAPTLGANETNTIQSLLALKDTYEFMAHFGDIGYAGTSWFGGVRSAWPDRLESQITSFAPFFLRNLSQRLTLFAAQGCHGRLLRGNFGQDDANEPGYRRPL